MGKKKPQKSAAAAKLKAEKKIKKRKAKAKQLASAPASAVGTAAQGGLGLAKKVKKAKKVKSPEQIQAAAERRAATKANKKLKKEKKAKKKLAKTAVSKTPVGVKKNKEKYNNKTPQEKKKRKREKLAAQKAKAETAGETAPPATSAETTSPELSTKEREQDQIPHAEGVTIASMIAEEPTQAPKKSKKKRKAVALELTAAPDLGAAEGTPALANPPQEVAVAMPEEAVETLAGAIQDANGGTIHLVATEPSSDGGRAGGAGRAFQRVKAEEWIGKKGALDNSYQATFGEDGWGAKAQQVLGQVRGKDFRHEKTKKKRGTYKGGQIDFKVNSFKYDSD